MKMNRLLLLVALLGFAVVAQADNGTRWLTYPGGDGPGQGKRIVLIAADQEYRSEESMPLMAKILSKQLGFVPKPVSAYR